jgi:cytoskeleton protein RodZ
MTMARPVFSKLKSTPTAKEMSTSIGQQLKQARMERNLSIEEVSHAIHVRMHYLHALENDDRAALPSDVQGRGFLRLYAGYLDLTVQDLLVQWEGKSKRVEAIDPSPEKPDKSPAKRNAGESAEAVQQEGAEIHEHIRTTQPPELKEKTPKPPKQLPTREVSPELVNLNGESAQILVSIGNQLRAQREHLSLSLEDVERFTHVRLHYLQALEEGRLDNLPSPVQGRGMLSNYATFLELDSEGLLLQFADALQTRRIERTPATVLSKTPKQPKASQASGLRRFITPDLIIGSIVILFLIGFAVWGAAQISSIGRSPLQPTAMNLSALMLTASPAKLPSESATVGAATPAASSGGNNSSSDASTPQVTGTIPVKGNDPIQVYVVAMQRVWMRVSEDDKEKFQGRVSPGNAYAFSANKKIELTTGDADGIEVFYNQNDLGVLGKKAQVINLIFTKDGMITPTAQFTPTPSATPLLTVTTKPTATVASPTVTIFVPK